MSRMFPFVLWLALGRILTAQKFCVKMKQNYLLVMLGHINPSQGTQFPGGLIRKPSTFVGRIPKCSLPIALGRPLFQKPVPKMSLFTRSWQALAGNLQRLFINITISLLFKKTVWPLLFWALAHTRPFDMSTLDLVGISKLASLHIKKTNKRTKEIMMYYIVFVIGVAFAGGYSCIWPWVICISRWAHRMGASTLWSLMGSPPSGHVIELGN